MPRCAAVSDERPWSGRRLHVVGVGGAGMSGLAVVARALGAEVTGSDRSGTGAALDRVRAAGVTVAAGHDAANVPAGDDVELVVSTAIPADNAERAAGRARGLRELHRSELLAEVTRRKRLIAVAGTHGKTTTTSMLAHALLAGGHDPAYLIGGELRTTGTNAAWGDGRVGRRRGRRVRRVLPAPGAGDRRRDERRARPPHDVRPRARTSTRPSAPSWPPPGRRSSGTAPRSARWRVPARGRSPSRTPTCVPTAPASRWPTGRRSAWPSRAPTTR